MPFQSNPDEQCSPISSDLPLSTDNKRKKLKYSSNSSKKLKTYPAPVMKLSPTKKAASEDLPPPLSPQISMPSTSNENYVSDSYKKKFPKRRGSKQSSDVDDLPPSLLPIEEEIEENIIEENQTGEPTTRRLPILKIRRIGSDVLCEYSTRGLGRSSSSRSLAYTSDQNHTRGSRKIRFSVEPSRNNSTVLRLPSIREEINHNDGENEVSSTTNDFPE